MSASLPSGCTSRAFRTPRALPPPPPKHAPPASRSRWSKPDAPQPRAATVRTHTGALAGADGAFDAFCAQAGIARCESLATLCETLKIFHTGGPLRGRRLLAMGASGGDMAMTADAARHLGLHFAPIPPARTARCAKYSPTASTSPIRSTSTPTSGSTGRHSARCSRSCSAPATTPWASCSTARRPRRPTTGAYVSVVEEFAAALSGAQPRARCHLLAARVALPRDARAVLRRGHRARCRASAKRSRRSTWPAQSAKAGRPARRSNCADPARGRGLLPRALAEHEGKARARRLRRAGAALCSGRAGSRCPPTPPPRSASRWSSRRPRRPSSTSPRSAGSS